ncbi:hypothetical protein C4M96_01425 [Mycoplasmopsis pullorum]|nr:hypothetical protein C4M96_01425 [Mycoplasmopsis pullorum]
MKQKKLIYLWITQSLNVLFCVFLLILIVLWSRERFFFFSKYNGTLYYHLYFYLIHSFLLVSIFFIFGHKIFILSKYWKNKIKDNFWTWFLIIVPFLDLFILKKDPNLDTINNDSFSNAKFRGFLFWLLPLISLILIYICFSINSMAYSFERTPYLNVSNSLEAEAKEITWIPWDGFFDFTLPNLSLDIYKTIPQYIICLLCSVLINLTFWNLIKPIFRLDFKLWKKTQIENTNTKKYLINTQLLNLMVLIFVLLLVFFEILWVQRDLKNWHALNYLHHWTSFYKHFQYYPEMLLYIIDYRAYNMITTFLMVSAIAIYLFRFVVLYKY